jgi:hypothetical protein
LSDKPIKEQWWHREAIALNKAEWNYSEIAEYFEIGKSTVSDFFLKLKGEYYGYNRGKPATAKDVVKPKARILLYDIETSPIIAQMWSMWQNGFGLNQIQDDWFIMSFAAKWLGEDEVFYYDQSESKNIEDDRDLLLKLWELLNEADVVIGQNLKKFDTKKTNARFILNGLPKPSTYRQIDTLDIAKNQFGFTSNKLEYMTDKLCNKHKKLKHQKFAGHSLWQECLKRNPEAWDEMKKYNIEDVLSLEELYNLFSSWDNKLPNYDVYVDDVLDMTEWEHDGYHYTSLGKYKRYRNKQTGQQRRSRVNLLSQKKRDSLLVNIL